MSLKSDLAYAFDAVGWSRDVLRFHPDPEQARVIGSGAHRGLLNCCRQWGKSSTAAVMAAHELAYGDRAKVVVSAPGGRQSKLLGATIREFCARVGPALRISKTDVELGTTFQNGSMLVELPASEAKVRGVSACTLLLVDEAAQVSTELRKTISPYLAVRNGRVWEMSTPFGVRGFFYDHWHKGGDEWFRVEVPASKCPRISAEFLAGERRELGEWWFRQEYCCEFVDLVSGVFDRNSVMRTVTPEVKPLFDPEVPREVA